MATSNENGNGNSNGKRKIKKSTIAIIISIVVAVIAGGAACFIAYKQMMDAQNKAAEAPKEYTGTYAEKIEAFYEDNKETAAGMSVAVFDGNENLYEGYFGYENKETGAPMDENTVIEWGSATKPLVWVSIMQLREQGRVDLYTDVRKYLPDGFLTNLRYDKPIRLIDLMNHRAGFEEKYEDLFLPLGEGHLTLGEALSVRQPEQVYAPDTVTAYSNWGVSLAAYVVENVSGMDFADYVHQNIFDVLGMEHTALKCGLTDNESVREARMRLNCYMNGKSIGQRFYDIELYPAGMCTSTLEDFATFGRALIADDCPLFFKEVTRDEMFTCSSYYSATGEGRNAHGLWAMPNLEGYVLGHGGNTYGCSSFILFDPFEQIGMVVMTNQYGETTFNNGVPELVFGVDEAFQAREAADFNGNLIFRSARVPYTGPFKMMSMSYVPSFMTKNYYPWSYNENDGIPKIDYYVMDLLAIPMTEFLFESCIYFSFMGIIAIAFVAIAIKAIRFIVNKIRRRPTAIYLGFWTTLMSVITILITAFYGFGYTACLALYWRSTTYFWVFTVVKALGIVGALVGLFTLILMIANRGGAKRIDVIGTSGRRSKLRAFVNVVEVLMAFVMCGVVWYLF